MSTFLHRIMAILNLERLNLERTVKVDELYASIEANGHRSR